jgi:transposase
MRQCLNCRLATQDQVVREVAAWEQTRNIKSGMIVAMSRYPKTTLASHLSTEALNERYRRCADPKEARRWHALWLFSTGKPIGDVAVLVSRHRNWILTVIQRYNAEGPEGVIDRHRIHPGGRAAALTPEQQHDLADALHGPAPDGGLWTGPKVAAWMAERLGRPIYPQLGWVYLRKLGFVLRQPRPHHQQAASADEQEAWKKN